MKVFVTGGTGYIGSAVVERLLGAGYAVSGLARSEEAVKELKGLGASSHKGDLTDRASIAEGVRESDAVIHMGLAEGSNSGKIDASAVDLLLRTLEGSQKRFLYTSGIWVLGDTGSLPADEDRPLNPTPLVSWRPAVEQQVLEAAHLGVHSVVIRPAIVFGRGGGIPGSMARTGLQEGVIRYVGNGENDWPFVFIADLADFYVRCLAAAPPGMLLHAAGGSSVKSKAVAEALAEGLQMPGKAESWPLEEAQSVLGPFADALVLSQRISAEKAKKQIGWKPSGKPVLDELRQNPMA